MLHVFTNVTNHKYCFPVSVNEMLSLPPIKIPMIARLRTIYKVNVVPNVTKGFDSNVYLNQSTNYNCVDKLSLLKCQPNILLPR